MKRILFALVLMSLLYGCSDGETGKTVSKDSAAVNSSQAESNQPGNTGAPDFLGLSTNTSKEYKGYLQGVKNSDSSGPYVYKEYYSDTLSFKLFYVPKTQEKSTVTFDSIKKAKENDFADYVLVGFVFPMQDPDVTNDNVKYPVSVKSYVRKEKNWRYLSEQTVKDLTELTQFQIKTIYSSMK